MYKGPQLEAGALTYQRGEDYQNAPRGPGTLAYRLYAFFDVNHKDRLNFPQPIQSASLTAMLLLAMHCSQAWMQTSRGRYKNVDQQAPIRLSYKNLPEPSCISSLSTDHRSTTTQVRPSKIQNQPQKQVKHKNNFLETQKNDN